MAKRSARKTLREGHADTSKPLVLYSKRVDHARIGVERDQFLHVGDIVHFDWGGENWGIVYDIFDNRGGEVLFIRNTKGFTGEWLAGKTEFRFPAELCRVIK
jgi:hypothetical protein